MSGRGALSTALQLMAARFAPRPPAPELRGELCLSVSETGWRATLRPGDGSAPETLQESLGTEQAALAPPDMLRRAVRAVTPSQRERIGSVRLLVADPAVSIVDNRSARIKSTDPAGIRQAGAQELGSPGAVFASKPFGQSSEHEVKRGVYAFATTDRARDYLGALDSLAVKLVQLLPASLLLLDTPEERPFAAIDVRATGSTLLLADPETGAVACRELAVGWRSFVAAMAEATSVSVRDAAEGLERRACFRPDAGASGSAGALATGTERALSPILAQLRTELHSTLDFFAFQRMAGAPERLWVSGEAHRVRGLTEWIGHAAGLEPTAGQDAHVRFLATSAAGSANLIEGLPKGLLRIGKVDYHFAEGRFRPDQPEAPARAARPPRELLQQRMTVALLRETLAAFDVKRVAVPALAVLGLGLVPWLSIDSAAAERHRAAAVLAAAIDEDATLRSAVVRRARPPAAGDVEMRLYWTEKLTAIAEAVPDAVWITRAGVTAGAQPAGDRLVLEGDVAAALADPLGRVTELIDRLSANAAFMRDVSAISFDGVTVAPGPGGDVAHFIITVVLAGQPRSAPRRG